MSEIKIGDLVEAGYNSGLYIGKVFEDRRNAYLVEVHAVIKHPTQGDLHNPGQVDGVAFHERKALAYKEKMNAGKRRVKKFTGEIPDYSLSLKNAVTELREQLLTEDTPYNQAALQKLADLETHFYKKNDY